jgi:hypothetical protein
MVKGIETLFWELYRDHWHAIRAQLVREGRLSAVWNDRAVAIEDLPVVRQKDGVLLFW